MAKSGICARMPKSEDLAVTSAASRFGRYKSEEEAYARIPTVIADREYEKLVSVWKGYAALFGVWRSGKESGFSSLNELDAVYQLACAILDARRFSARTVLLFSAAFGELHSGENMPQYAAGAFFSALMNLGKASSFRLNVAGAAPLNGLCYKNIKDVTICGDVGHSIGAKMASGRVVVAGAAVRPISEEMEGGTLILNGDALHAPWMGGCFVGMHMKGGEVQINGDFFSSKSSREEAWYPDIRLGVAYGNGNGRIFHRGKLIADGSRMDGWGRWNEES